MRKELFAMAVIAMLLISIPALAQVGKSYRSFRTSDFARSFTITKTTERSIEDGKTVLGHEPGKHRKHIDVIMTVSPAMAIVKAELHINRVWLGDKKLSAPYATGIVTAFVTGMVCKRDEIDINKMVEAVDKKETDAFKKTLVPEFEVFAGEKPKSSRKLDGCNLTFKNVTRGDLEWLQVVVKSDK
jgi:hypothetical protein